LKRDANIIDLGENAQSSRSFFQVRVGKTIAQCRLHAFDRMGLIDPNIAWRQQ